MIRGETAGRGTGACNAVLPTVHRALRARRRAKRRGGGCGDAVAAATRRLRRRGQYTAVGAEHMTRGPSRRERRSRPARSETPPRPFNAGGARGGSWPGACLACSRRRYHAVLAADAAVHVAARASRAQRSSAAHSSTRLPFLLLLMVLRMLCDIAVHMLPRTDEGCAHARTACTRLGFGLPCINGVRQSRGARPRRTGHVDSMDPA